MYDYHSEPILKFFQNGVLKALHFKKTLRCFHYPMYPSFSQGCGAFPGGDGRRGAAWSSLRFFAQRSARLSGGNLTGGEGEK